MGEWFATTQPQLAANQSIGYDLMVITNGAQFKKFVQGGWLAPLDHSKLPKFGQNAAAAYKNSSYDRGNVYSIPWQSGITGVAYYPEKTGRRLTSLEDLWDPAFSNQIGMMSDVSELGNFGMLALGIDPATSTPDDWRRAADKLEEQKSKGVVRAYYDQDYLTAFENGDISICQAWSGDIFQLVLSGLEVEFFIPEEGATIWTDNMTIPITATNPVDAITLMDFFYDPEVAATLAEYINYITPVPAAKEAIAGHAEDATDEEEKAYLEELTTSPMIFPAASDYGKLSYYRDFATPDEETQYNEIFEPVVLG
jgi:spermidine/putrescine transport system substrate-binding protein